MRAAASRRPDLPQGGWGVSFRKPVPVGEQVLWGACAWGWGWGWTRGRGWERVRGPCPLGGRVHVGAVEVGAYLGTAARSRGCARVPSAEHWDQG